MSQMKEHNKTPEKELNRIKTSNRPDAEFKTFVIRMLSGLRGRLDEPSKNFSRETGTTKMETEDKNQPVKYEEYRI